MLLVACAHRIRVDRSIQRDIVLAQIGVRVVHCRVQSIQACSACWPR